MSDEQEPDLSCEVAPFKGWKHGIVKLLDVTNISIITIDILQDLKIFGDRSASFEIWTVRDGTSRNDVSPNKFSGTSGPKMNSPRNTMSLP